MSSSLESGWACHRGNIRAKSMTAWKSGASDSAMLLSSTPYILDDCVFQHPSLYNLQQNYVTV
jgi:hypothetical protein